MVELKFYDLMIETDPINYLEYIEQVFNHIKNKDAIDLSFN